MKRTFDTFGVMIDMSRNAVMSMDGLKRFLPLLKKMGYNCVMLYTEDTYEVDGEPYLGYMRGRYTKAEMKEIDAFAASLGITVIPCIQTLAHLNATLRWKQLPVDCGDILMVDDERTYEFIDHMFATLFECFASRKIHIGMDEAHMLGRGKHLDQYGYEDVNTLMTRHLNRIREIAKKYDYELMIWSDMYFRSWCGGKYFVPKAEVPKDVIDSFPGDVIPIYWDYYQTEEKKYADMIENHLQISKKTWFAGGIRGWSGLVPFNRFSIEAMLPALDACKKHKIRHAFMTLWGDDGGEGSHFAQLPALFYLAQYAKGVTDEAIIKKKFKSLIGIDFDEFMQIDLPNEVVPYDGKPKNPAKYMLYADCFNDFLDYTVKPGAGKNYVEFAEKLHATSKKSRRYGYIFASEATLCDVLAVKYELGLKTRRAYEAGDKAELRRLAEEDYPTAIKRIKIHEKAFEKQWMCENKACGFDIQHQRFGGLLFRLDACRKRILDYTNGNLDRIEELDEKLLPYGEAETSGMYNGVCYSTTNIVASILL